MDPQVSFMRILIGDNVQPYTYTDAQLRSAMVWGTQPALPNQVLISATVTQRQFPSDTSGGPFTGPF